MKLTSHLLSSEDRERVHARSLQLLEDVGVRYHSRKALQLLKHHGATVDWDNRIARIPPELVRHTLDLTPKTFVLGARNPAHDYGLPSSVTHFAMDGTAAFATDFETGERRYGRRQDIANGLRILQEMDLAVMAWPPTCASDAPEKTRPLHEFFTMMKGCSKHGQHELYSMEQVTYLVEGLKAVLGSEAAIRSRNAYSLIYCPIAPLTHDGSMLDTYLELGQLGMPVMVMPMPVGGTTGPASLFSIIYLANAEVLSALVVFQLAHPGRPVIFSSATGAMNFRSGGFLGGTPEVGLQSAALVGMGRFYGLPSSAAGCTSDALQPGPEAVLEKVITTLPIMMAGSDLIIGFGEIEGDQNLVLEQIIVDNEIGHLCQRLVSGVDSGDTNDLFADIGEAGPGGHFLLADSTRKAARSGEFYHSKLILRQNYETWLESGSPTMYNRARDKVESILAGPMVDPLPGEVEQQLDEILRDADQKLNGM